MSLVIVLMQEVVISFTFHPVLHHFKHPINVCMFWLRLLYLHEVTFQATLTPVVGDTSL